MFLLLALSCSADDAAPDTAVEPVDWSRQQVWLDEEVRGRSFQRAILHLHSPYSHDACDGDGLPDGAVNEPCMDDLRAGLCASGIGLAFVTDHPSHAAEFSFEDWLSIREGDRPVERDGAPIANRFDCEGGGEVLWMAGIEDELMPVGLDRHVDGTAEERDTLYNQETAVAIGAEIDAGAAVMVAHTEGRDVELLVEQQAAGLTGFEMFNLHAKFAPDNLEDDLGLDPYEWIEGVGPFLDAGNDDLVPDLAFLAVYQQQDVSIATWDTLNAIGPAVGFGGTDAHQNVLPSPASDGERFDSYRRMTRWFSNWVLVDAAAGEAAEPEDAQAAVAAGRIYTVFEVLGTPAGLDVAMESGGETYEIGSDAPAGTLRVDCPILHPESARGLEAPEIRAEVFKDGESWAAGCGEHAVSEAGVYRVVFYITPHHLADFLDDQQHLVQEYPWIYSNPFRVD